MDERAAEEVRVEVTGAGLDQRGRTRIEVALADEIDAQLAHVALDPHALDAAEADGREIDHGSIERDLLEAVPEDADLAAAQPERCDRLRRSVVSAAQSDDAGDVREKI